MTGLNVIRAGARKVGAAIAFVTYEELGGNNDELTDRHHSRCS